MKLQTIVLTIKYDPQETDVPCNWPLADMLDIPSQDIVSATWWHDGKDHVPEIEHMQREEKK